MELVQDEIISIREKLSSLEIRLNELEVLQQKLEKVTISSSKSSTFSSLSNSSSSSTTTLENTSNNNDDNTNYTNNNDDFLLIEHVVKMLECNYFTNLRQVIDHFPKLLSNRNFWMKFLQSKERMQQHFLDFVDVFYFLPPTSSSAQHEELLLVEQNQRVLPTQLRNDKELMILACSYDMRIYERMVETPWSLKDDVDIICAALNCSPLSLLYIDSVGQKMYPTIIANAIKQLPLYIDELQTQIRYHLDYSLWQHRDVALAWVQSGGKFLENHFPESFRDDPELLLAHIKQQTMNGTSSCGGGGRTRSSNKSHNDVLASFPSSPRLRSDKNFMLQAIELNGRLLACITSKELVHDFDLVLTAFSDLDTMVYFGNNYCRVNWMLQPISSIRGNQTPTNNSNANYEYLANFAKKVKAKLRSYDNFMTVLCAISLVNKDSNNPNYDDDNNNNKIIQRYIDHDDNSKHHFSDSCHLPLLDQGNETKIDAYAKLIAQYLDVPTGRHLVLLKRAHQNLSLWGLK